MAELSGNVEVKVVVLTLRQASDRQARIKKLLDDAGIEFEFFWGVDGRKDRDPCFTMYDEEKRLRTKGNPMTPGQLGCFASHYHIWQSCLRDDRSYLVLEDDAVFEQEKMLTFLKCIPELPVRVECLRLFENKTRNHKEFLVGHAGIFKILRYTKGPMSTMGYFLTPRAAQKFLASANPIFLSVDIYMDRYWVNSVECLGLAPAIVSHDYAFDSMIGYEKKSRNRSIYIRLLREAFTLTERLRRFFFNIRLSPRRRSREFSHHD